ncbi:aminotransferase class I/II-fold pyridoxal phosphate-dependent enzyme [Sporolactobacillus sp. CPB3-1]|uniref:Aminotransferase class I/II-fold pyridoxal phosphate-dependent enzyme n=1 Tax=Sporolactobacillus mangiferae TaxID=2940498 RepID=A0ABT0MC42_9BACL|nr:aminotransferase class I/II-fold pyridoxal phosphate-dependent enzyme [Sporolactobacillus mangiferae]MCL1632444.1 aminotransferase class I/II-fold pyridoxal phosphate-dependent enzyme [Sporolactobacillus mangiferae]
MDQHQTPVYDALIRYGRDQAYSFHVPGHKDGLVFPEKALLSFQSILALDATEVADLDDLYHPEGVLREAEQLLTNYYGSRMSCFLVNGSTVGNLIMVLAACAPGDVVLVQRNSHKSVFNALKLADVRPVFLAPSVDTRSGLATGIEPQTFSEALRRFPDAKALILTYPSYYGVAPCTVRRLIVQAHEAGMNVLVDEAHGPHFRMGAPVPPSSLDMGADLVVHSAHKMLPAMTMGAYLHVNSTRISIEKVKMVREMLQSSSPSYPIMASLDLARAFMATMDSEFFADVLNRRDAFVEALKSMNLLTVLEADPEHFLVDPFKIVLQPETRVSGFELQSRFIQLGLYPEMADPRHILLTLGLSDSINYQNAVRKIEKALAHQMPGQSEVRTLITEFPPITMLADSYRHFKNLASSWSALDQAVGAIAAEPVVPYPPGIPIVLGGERITERSLELIHFWQRAGATFQNEGIHQGKIKVYQSREQSA